MCLYPISAFRYLCKETGETGVRVSRHIPQFDEDLYTIEPLTLACGKCIECQQDKTREWSFRIMDEASKYKDNCCVTLTYNDENLPVDGNLCIRDYQLFLKLLRRHIGRVRYFVSGEYGGKFLRPHFHIILFGYKPDDLYYWSKSKSGQDLFRSSTIEKFWTKGFSSIGELSLNTAKYCAKYLQKYLYQTDSRLAGKVPPFIRMSTHPGIGSDYSPCLATDKLYKACKWVKTPRYYLKRADIDGVDLTALKANRRLKSILFQRSLSDLKKHRKFFEKNFKNCLTFYSDRV